MTTDWTLYAGIIAAAVIVVFAVRVIRAKVEDDPGMKYDPHPDDDRLPNYERDGFIIEDNQKIRFEHSIEVDASFYTKLENLAVGEVVTLTFDVLVEADPVVELEDDAVEYEEIEKEPTEEPLEILQAITDTGNIEDLEDLVGTTEENEPEIDEALLEPEPGHEPVADKPELPVFEIENMDVVNLDVKVVDFDGEMIKGKLTQSAESSDTLKAGFEVWFHRNHVLLFAEDS